MADSNPFMGKGTAGDLSEFAHWAQNRAQALKAGTTGKTRTTREPRKTEGVLFVEAFEAAGTPSWLYTCSSTVVTEGRGKGTTLSAAEAAARLHGQIKRYLDLLRSSDNDTDKARGKRFWLRERSDEPRSDQIYVVDLELMQKADADAFAALQEIEREHAESRAARFFTTIVNHAAKGTRMEERRPIGSADSPALDELTRDLLVSKLTDAGLNADGSAKNKKGEAFLANAKK